MNSKELGLLITKKRKEQNLTQKQLAEKLKVSDKSISKWENGVDEPNLMMLSNICKELNISLKELHFNIENPKKEDDKNTKIISNSVFKWVFYTISYMLFITIIMGCATIQTIYQIISKNIVKEDLKIIWQNSFNWVASLLQIVFIMSIIIAICIFIFSLVSRKKNK